MNNRINLKLVFAGIAFAMFFCASLFCAPNFALSTGFSLGQECDFFVDPAYDSQKRSEISASLEMIGSNLFFYFDKDWWEKLDDERQKEVKKSLTFLAEEFVTKIYPELTASFGRESRPGIDGDKHITILVHPMLKQAGGYFRSNDGYSKLQIANSNEKEMVYLNAEHITDPLIKTFLAHEFTHLITFNQKQKTYGVEEEIWLNEARAEFASTLLGYDNEEDEKNNIQKRVEIFLNSPSDSLIEWQNKESDYGALNMFIQYLVEKYGIEILIDSLKSEKTGINSLNYALEKNGFEQDFAQIFTDWTIAILVNNCSISAPVCEINEESATDIIEIENKYCYKNKNLNNLRVVPLLNFIPLKGKTTLGVTQATKNWAGNWFQFIGGTGTLKIEFIGNPENLFRVPYIAQDISGKSFLDFFELDEYQRGEILIPKFGIEIVSVVIIPSIQSKTIGSANSEPAIPFFWEATTIDETQDIEEPETEEQENINYKYLEKPIEQMSEQEILDKISEIEKILTLLKESLSAFRPVENTPQQPEQIQISCEKLENNLSYGTSNEQTKCLQEFLSLQGAEIYPEALITGFFGRLTQKAVIRFQEKFADDILAPWGLLKGTGFVGSTTIKKINELML
jgi:hypothetical protein